MALGDALGGAATGLGRGITLRQQGRELGLRERALLQDRDLRERALGIEERKLEQGAQNDLLAQADDLISKQLKIASTVIEEGKKAGRPLPQIAQAVRPILKSVEQLATRAGRDPAIYSQQVDAMLTTPSAEEVAAQEGKVSAAKTISETQALEAAGVSEGNVIENIRTKIARGESLTPGEERVYNDQLRSSGDATIEILKGFGLIKDEGDGGLPEPTSGSSTAPSKIPPVPENLKGRGAQWSPSRQRWYLPDGTVYNQQGVPS